MDTLKFSIVLLALILVNVPTFSAEKAYVHPSNSSDCPGEPCLTLDEYAENVTEYSIPGTEFIFLSGEHFLNIPLTLTSITNINLTGDSDNEAKIISLSALVRIGPLSSDISLNFLQIQSDYYSLIVGNSDSIKITNVTFLV